MSRRIGQSLAVFSAVIFALAVTACTGSEEGVRVQAGDQSALIERPGTCAVPEPFDFDPCLRQPFPRTRLALLKQEVPASGLIFGFGPKGRTEARLYRLRAGRRERIGRWADVQQATDSPSIRGYRFRDPRTGSPRLRSADTLRLVLFDDDGGTGLELALPPVG